MLRLIGNKYNPIQNDKLVVFQNTSGWQSEKIYIYIYKLTFQTMFKNKGFDIIVNCNMKIVNYLGVTLKLNNGSYRLYKDPN